MHHAGAQVHPTYSTTGAKVHPAYSTTGAKVHPAYSTTGAKVHHAVKSGAKMSLIDQQLCSQHRPDIRFCTAQT
jgi:hypothetical protein